MPVVDHPGQLAHRQAVDVWNRELADERTPARLHRRTFDPQTADWIWPIEHHKRDLVFARRLHAAAHRADVGVAAAADILQIKDQHIDSAQHLWGRLARRPVERMRDHAGQRVAPALHVVAGLFRAVEPVLRRVERDEVAMAFQEQSRLGAGGS